MPRFSIVMPVHNAEATLQSTLDKLFSQSFADIEVIAVDDASLDDSGSILDRYAELEPRLKVVHHTENTYTGQARKDGVMVSTGDYILFSDQDDDLDTRACERLAGIIAEHPVDIVHYGTNGVIADDVESDYQGTLDAFLRPYDGVLTGEGILRGCFFDRSYAWNIWNKAYRADLCKAAHAEMDMVDIRYGEDFYAYYLLSYYAESYMGVSGDALYTYYYGSGQTGHSCVDMKLFRFTCTAATVVDRIETFARSHMPCDEADDHVEKIRSLLIWEPACMFKTNVSVNDKPEALRLFLEKWGRLNGLGMLRRLYDKEEGASLACELFIGGGVGDLLQEEKPCKGRVLDLSSEDASSLVWDVLDAKSRGLLCFAAPWFSLPEAAREASVELLRSVFLFCLCDAIAVPNAEDAACWRSLGVETVVVLRQSNASEEEVREECMKAWQERLSGDVDIASAADPLECRFVQALLLLSLSLQSDAEGLQMRLEQSKREADLMRLGQKETSDRLDALLRSTTWRVGSLLTWPFRKLKDSFPPV